MDDIEYGDAIAEDDQQKDTHHYSCLASLGFNRREVRRFRKPHATTVRRFRPKGGFDGGFVRAPSANVPTCAAMERNLAEYRFAAAYSVTSERRSPAVMMHWSTVFLPSKRRALSPRMAGALVPPLFLAGCSGGVLEPRGPIGAANTTIIYNALAIMLVVVLPTIVATLAFAWWFRGGNPRAQYRPDWVYSGRIELLVWAIPLLVIMFLGGVIWIGSHKLDPFKPIASPSKPTEVQVVSLDWKWLFIYPDHGIASVNELTVPAGVPVHFSLTSATVMNSFFVPQLGSMIATMNGMVTQLNLQADHPGDYHGQSVQFSGDGFSGMHFTVHAVPEDEFARWLERARNAPSALDRNGYVALSQQSQNVRPFTYRDVEPGLFAAIATQQIPPGPGPSGGSGGVSVRPSGGK